jgi:hypothetical protein
VSSQASTDKAADLLFVMREKGVRLWLADGRLRYQAPRGAITQEELSELRSSAEEITAFLQQSPASDMPALPLTPRHASARVPLTPGQKGWFDILKLEKQRSALISVATRLLGPVNIAALERSIVELVRRHEALRTRIVTADDMQWQVVDESADASLKIIDLTCFPDHEREIRTRHALEQFENESIEVAKGPLFAARALRLGEEDYVLVLSIDHLISDAMSVGVLVRDLWTLYQKIDQGLSISLPKVAIQFPDYAVWLERLRRLQGDQPHVYWGRHLAGARRARLNLEAPEKAIRAKYGTVPIRLCSDIATRLEKLSRLERTTIPICAFTAYAALIFRWCNITDQVLGFAIAGRHHAAVQNSIGMFASHVVLRVSLLEEDSFITLLKKVEAEYSMAYQHSMEALTGVDTSEIFGTGGFSWIPQEIYVDPVRHTRNCDEYILGGGVKTQPFPLEMRASPFDDLDIDIEPSVYLSDRKDSVEGYLLYRTNRVKLSAMERLARNLVHFAGIVAVEPNTRVSSIACL